MSEGLVHLLQLLVSGVVTGGIYALVAMGFVVVYKATRVINFATGEFMMLGAFFAWTAMSAVQAPFVVALLAAVAASALLGMATERLVLRPLLGQRTISIIMVTIGLAAIFKGLAQIAWSGDYRSFPTIFPRSPIELGPILIPSRQFYPSLIALGAIVIVGLGFRFTRTGVAMRATADDQMAAFGMGIDIRRIFSLSWSLAAMTAAVAGIVVGIIGGISPQLGAIGLRTFPVVILGGLDSIGGALVGGVIIGLGGGVTTKAFVFTSLLTIPAFSNMGLYAVAILAAFLTSMILVILSGYRTPEQAAAAAAAGVSVADLEGPMGEASPDTLVAAAATKAAGDVGVTTEILSPLAGTVIALSDVPDPVFGKGILGPGIAVIPSGNTAYAPGSGVVVAAQPTGQLDPETQQLVEHRRLVESLLDEYSADG